MKLLALLVVLGVVSVGGYRLLNQAGDALAEDLVLVLNQPTMQEQFRLSAAVSEAECSDDRTFAIVGSVGNDWHDCTATLADGTVRPFCVLPREPSPGIGESRTCADVRRDIEKRLPGSTSD